MKKLPLLIVFSLTTFLSLNSFACSCFFTDICNYYQSIEGAPGEVIFKGTFIQEEFINGNTTKMVQYKVDKLYRGEIVTPDSPIYIESTFNNTDSTIWVMGGNSAFCMRDVDPQTAIFAIQYYTTPFLPFGDYTGYVLSTCNQDYFPISDNETITGYFWAYNEVTSMSVVECVDLMFSCVTTSIHDIDDYSSKTIIYPQPCSDFLSIQLPPGQDDWSIRLINAQGKEIRKVESLQFDMHDLNAGIYFLRFSNTEGMSFLKRVIKV